MKNFKTLVAGAFCAMLGTAEVASAQQAIEGSDTLRQWTQQIIQNAGLSAQLTYIGGGSGRGETALVDGTQQIAPMSRFLGGSGAAAGVCDGREGTDGIQIDFRRL